MVRKSLSTCIVAMSFGVFYTEGLTDNWVSVLVPILMNAMRDSYCTVSIRRMV
jgi:hypothetical protein